MDIQLQTMGKKNGKPSRPVLYEARNSEWRAETTSGLKSYSGTYYLREIPCANPTEMECTKGTHWNWKTLAKPKEFAVRYVSYILIAPACC